jgi:hypothetical protein
VAVHYKPLLLSYRAFAESRNGCSSVRGNVVWRRWRGWSGHATGEAASCWSQGDLVVGVTSLPAAVFWSSRDRARCGRGGRVAEGAAFEMRSTFCVAGVRIPPSPVSTASTTKHRRPDNRWKGLRFFVGPFTCPRWTILVPDQGSTTSASGPSKLNVNLLKS